MNFSETSSHVEEIEIFRHDNSLMSKKLKYFDMRPISWWKK